MRISAALKITGIYLGVGFLWIFFSDRFLSLLSPYESAAITQLQTIKGWFYVGATAALLYWLIQREININRRTTQQLQKTVAELLETRKALQTNQDQFTAFMNYNPAASWIMDEEGCIQYVSQSYLRMFQVPPDLIGHKISELYPQEVVQTYLEEIQTIAQTGYVLETIERGVRADGVPGQFLVYKFPLPQLNGTQYVGGVAIDVTEQQTVLRDRDQAEAALKASEEQLRLALEFAQIGIWDWDLHTNQISWNRHHFKLLGLPPDSTEANYDIWRNGVHPDDVAWVEAAINHALQTQTTYEAEYRICHPDRSVHWVSGKGRALYDASGQPTRMIGGLLDITERKQTEDQLRKQFNLLSMAQQAAQMGVYEWDLVSDQAYWTPEMENLMGMKLEARSHNLAPWFAQVHPEDRVRLEQQFADWLHSDQQPEKDEYRFNRQGDERWIDARGYIIRDVNGKALRMIGTNLDITERKQAEAALYQREQEFRALAENAPDLIVRLDRALRYCYVNPAITAVTGLSPHKFIGKTMQEMEMPVVQITQWEATLTRTFATGEQQHLEFQFSTPQGLRDYQARCVPEFTAAGSVTSMLMVARDMTEQKQLERMLRQQAERLELTSAITQRIRQSLHLKDILNTTVIEMKQWLQADRVIVYQFAPDRSGTIVAEAVAPGWPVALGTVIEDTCFRTGAGAEYRQGKKRAIADVATAGFTDCHCQLLAQFEVKASLMVPIVVMLEDTQPHLWGLLITHQCDAPRHWQPDHLDLLDQIALRLAIAIQQAQTFEQAQRELLERQQAETHLRTALAEKEVLLKEIHHRVKNNLQIVSGLLQLQAQGLTDPQIVNALRESQNRIESMSLIHKKLYTASDLGQIDVADYIQSLAVSLLTTYKILPGTVALQVEVEPVTLNLDQAIPCGLIINELVSNALKYAFPDNRSGEIFVKLYQVEHQLELIIHDNGIGLPPHLNWQNAHSLGLSLVEALTTEQLEGSLEVQRDPGTTFTIKFRHSSFGG